MDYTTRVMRPDTCTTCASLRNTISEYKRKLRDAEIEMQKQNKLIEALNNIIVKGKDNE